MSARDFSDSIKLVVIKEYYIIYVIIVGILQKK